MKAQTIALLQIKRGIGGGGGKRIALLFLLIFGGFPDVIKVIGLEMY